MSWNLNAIFIMIKLSARRQDKARLRSVTLYKQQWRVCMCVSAKREIVNRGLTAFRGIRPVNSRVKRLSTPIFSE